MKKIIKQMSNEEFLTALDLLQRELIEKQKNLIDAFLRSNCSYTEGDIFEDEKGFIRIIRITVRRFPNFYGLCFFGQSLKKDLTPKSRNSRRWVKYLRIQG